VGAQRVVVPPNKALIKVDLILRSRRISACPDALVKLMSMSAEHDDQDGLRARSEQAIGELAQALLDSQVLENAVAAAFGAREKALEAQHAAMAALNLPSASDVERLERRLRSLSRRLEEVEDQLDRVDREVGGLRRELKDAVAPQKPVAAKD
jgi:chromosome segregation ATPase